jgi:membrane dipeptidase
VSTVVDHIQHVAAVGGVDHVGLGGDYDGVEVLPVGLEDVSCYPAITVELLTRGWSEPDIRKVLGENAMRALRQAEDVAGR